MLEQLVRLAADESYQSEWLCIHTDASMDVKGSCSAHHLHPPRRAGVMTQGWSRADLEPEGLMTVLGPCCKLCKVKMQMVCSVGEWLGEFTVTGGVILILDTV